MPKNPEKLQRPVFECPRVNAIFEAIKKNQGSPLLLREAPQPRELTEIFNAISFEGLKQIPNTMIHAEIAPETYYPQSPMPLTFGYIVHGKMVIQKDKQRLTLRDHSYHLTNASVFSTEAEEASEVFRISFQPDFIEKVFTDWTSAPENLLDDPEYNGSSPIHFVEKFYAADETLQGFLLKLRDELENQELHPLRLEERFHELGEHLLWVHHDVKKELARVSALKTSTRNEIYRRLNQARDFMEASLEQTLNLDSICKKAALSKHHFLRLFKQVFRKTPYQYLLGRRLEVFKNRLRTSSKNITELCYSLGFQDLSNLNRLFRREFGLSPQQYRQSRK